MMVALLVLQLLLTLVLAVAVVALLAFFRQSSSTGQHSRAAPSRRRRRRNILVSDPAIVQLTLIDHADAFSNRPKSHFPNFSGTHSINSVPHGPLWRALRCNLTAGILHPTRLHLLTPLQQQAAEALVTDLSSTTTRGGEVVVVRGSLHASVFALSARFCFGDHVPERRVRAMEREVLQFTMTFVHDSVLFAGGSSRTTTRLRHWRRWLRYTGTFRRVYNLVHPIIVAARRRRRSSSGGGGGDICSSYVDSLLDLQIPVHNADSENNNGTTTTTTAGMIASKRRPLTDKEMVRLVFEFLGANTESIVSCVEWTLAHLVIDPEVQRKLHHEVTATGSNTIQRDKGGGGTVVSAVSDERVLVHHRLPPYLRAVMLESLRLHPPVPLITRDVSAKDAAIAAGTPPAAAAASSTDSGGVPAIVITDIHKVGRNSKVWRDPDEFRPERFLAGGEAEGVGPVPGPKEIRMVSFGAGRRYCPGVELAMVRVGCILTALVRDFEWASPADDDGSLDLKEFRGFFSMMKTPLRARITTRVR